MSILTGGPDGPGLPGSPGKPVFPCGKEEKQCEKYFQITYKFSSLVSKAVATNE